MGFDNEIRVTSITFVSLSDVGLATMIAEIAPGAATQRVRPIGGGLASATFAVDTTVGDLIVKLFRPHRRDEAPLEWDRLTFAQRVAGVPVPEPVALDADGRWFGSSWQQRCTGTPRQFAARVPPFLRQALAELGA